jgi:deoxyribodipyrimidine photo-lyase
VRAVPLTRIQVRNQAPVRAGGEFVLYWMLASRRAGFNFGLQRAAEWAVELGRPLLVLEALRLDYPSASPRFHRFVLEGMADNAAAFARGPARYHAYVETSPGEGRGLLAALGARACCVVSDDYPTFFLPRALAAAAQRLPVRLEGVDGNGLVPMRAAGRSFPTAHAFRRHLHRVLPACLDEAPRAAPLVRLGLPRLDALPGDVVRRWPGLDAGALGRLAAEVERLSLDRAVGPLTAVRGGSRAGQARLARFVKTKLPGYAEDRNHPDLDASSGLSAYLHFGHLSAHQVAQAVLAAEGFDPRRLDPGARGARRGFWGVGEGAEAFLDQLVTWRELGFHHCAATGDARDLSTLPDWARRTLAAHARDRRPVRHDLETLEAARTGDPLWNAAQRELVQEGRIHNYLRMLWGKKILEWSPSPRQALEAMLQLNDRWALDGRDPNSLSGILWVLGKYDRPWGPERPIFGTVRFMSSENTARKLRLKKYLKRYGEDRV